MNVDANTGGLIFCQRCGFAYTDGASHTCSSSNGTFTYGSGWTQTSVDGETKELLRRIAIALEKIAELNE